MNWNYERNLVSLFVSEHIVEEKNTSTLCAFFASATLLPAAFFRQPCFILHPLYIVKQV